MMEVSKEEGSWDYTKFLNQKEKWEERKKGSN